MRRRRLLMLPLAIAVSGQAPPLFVPPPIERIPIPESSLPHNQLRPPGLAPGRKLPIATLARQLAFARLLEARDFRGIVAVRFADGSMFGNGDDDGTTERRWASVSRQVVAVLVMQEVQRGRIDLDAALNAESGGDAGLVALLEATTGKSLATLVRDRIAKPLQLRSVRVLDARDAGNAGRLVGTSDDLLAFDRALIDGRLLGKVATAAMWASARERGYAAFGQLSYPVELAGCRGPQQIVESRGQVGDVQVRNLIVPARGIAIVAFAGSSPREFGDALEGTGLTYDILRAALCA